MKKLSEVPISECQTTKGRDFFKSSNEIKELEVLKSKLSKPTIGVLNIQINTCLLENDLEQLKSLQEKIGCDMNFYELRDLIEYVKYKNFIDNQKRVFPGQMEQILKAKGFVYSNENGFRFYSIPGVPFSFNTHLAADGFEYAKPLHIFNQKVELALRASNIHLNNKQ